MLRTLTIATSLLLAAGPVLAANSAPRQLILRCTVSDDHDQLRVDFQPGEKFQYNIYLNVPPQDAGRKVLIEGSLTAKVNGFPLGASLPALDVTIPNQSVRDQIPGWDPAIDEATADGIEVRRSSGFVLIPDRFPDGNARLRLSARFAPGTPAEATLGCDKQLRVRHVSGS